MPTPTRRDVLERRRRAALRTLAAEYPALSPAYTAERPEPATREEEARTALASSTAWARSPLVPPGHLYATTDPEPATREDMKDIAGVWAYSPTPQGAVKDPPYRPTLWEHLEEG